MGRHKSLKHTTNTHQTRKTYKTYNKMSNVIVALGGTVKADKSDEFKAFAKTAIAKAREAAGCEWVKVMVDKENPHAIAIFQSWNDPAAQQAYAEAAKAEGKLAEIVGSCLEAGSFKRRVFSPYSE